MRRAAAEAADLQRHIRATGETFALEPWDWAYYAERVRIERHALDADELRAYFELERVLRDGVFFVAGRLYGPRFVERPEPPCYHPDAAFEVLEEDGAPLGLFIADFHTRDGKHGGAWANSLARQSTLLGSAPVACSNLTLARAAGGRADAAHAHGGHDDLP